MAITQGQNANASDFINATDRNATPANDAGRVPKMEADGYVNEDHMEVANAKNIVIGEAFTGATTPQPAYVSKSDGKAYLCDGNDTDKLKFVGFITSSGSANDTERLVVSGLIRGFSGLSAGEKYYLSDTAGAISTTAGTYEVLVGIAISSTVLLVQKGRRHASGSFSETNPASPTDQNIEVGFRVSRIVIFYGWDDDSVDVAHGQGIWSANGGYEAMYLANGGTWALSTNRIAHLEGGGGTVLYITVTNVDDTGFTFDLTNSGSYGSGQHMRFAWIAEGDF